MLLTALLVVTTLLPRIEIGVGAARGDWRARLSSLATMGAAPAPMPRFLPEARAVSNWREEGGTALRPASLALVVRYAATDPAFVARCVKLNNYWCIKRARWDGEIGADAEGHTGFATAAAGADAAAQLLRRYYRAFGRRTALGIVRRWAPAECRLPGAAAPVAAAASPRVSPDIAPRGIGRTLRARYLARQGRGAAPKRVAVARQGGLRVQPWSARARLVGRPGAPGKAAPPPKTERVATAEPATPGLLVRPSTILAKPSVLLVKPSVLLVEPSVVLGKSPTRTAAAAKPSGTGASRLADRFAAESAMLPPIAAGLPNIPLLDLRLPTPICGHDETRIRNYAARIGGSVGLGIEDDLKLFSIDGSPTANLAPVMLAMSNVELGTLRAGPALVEAAIGRLSDRPAAATETPAALPR